MIHLLHTYLCTLSFVSNVVSRMFSGRKYKYGYAYSDNIGNMGNSENMVSSNAVRERVSINILIDDNKYHIIA